MYENIRSTIIRLFARIDDLENFDLSSVSMNSAFEVANNAGLENYTYEANKSMWYCPGVTSVEEMTPH